MRVFIAGVMQGTRAEGMWPQDYRGQIADLLRAHLPGVEIWDPYQIHPGGLSYAEQEAKRALVEMVELGAKADCLIAYVPEASMGTAVEMWQAHQTGVPVYTISPLAENWVVLSLSTEVFPDLDAFAEFVAQGGLTER